MKKYTNKILIIAAIVLFLSVIIGYTIHFQTGYHSGKIKYEEREEYSLEDLDITDPEELEDIDADSKNMKDIESLQDDEALSENESEKSNQ